MFRKEDESEIIINLKRQISELEDKHYKKKVLVEKLQAEVDGFEPLKVKLVNECEAAKQALKVFTESKVNDGVVQLMEGSRFFNSRLNSFDERLEEIKESVELSMKSLAENQLKLAEAFKEHFNSKIELNDLGENYDETEE